MSERVSVLVYPELPGMICYMIQRSDYVNNTVYEIRKVFSEEKADSADFALRSEIEYQMRRELDDGI